MDERQVSPSAIYRSTRKPIVNVRLNIDMCTKNYNIYKRHNYNNLKHSEIQVTYKNNT
jgi:hypothetical protein